jgi:hypothetical protein
MLIVDSVFSLLLRPCSSIPSTFHKNSELNTNPPKNLSQVDQDKLDIESIPQAWLEPYMESEILDEEAMTYAGVNYKDKLKEIRDKKKGGRAASATPPAAAVTVTTPPLPPAAPVKVEAPAAVVARPPPPPVQAQPPVVVPQAVSMPSPPAQTVPPPASTTAGTLSDDAKRQTLRTFMGLLLKHRGGSGFGKGRLQGDDIDKFEDAMNKVTAMLKQEAGASGSPTTVVAAVPPPQAAVVATPPPVSQYTPVATVAPPASPGSSAARVTGIIACIEGAILMYKNSPPEMKEGVLITLRAALVSAVNTCNAVIAESNGGVMTVNFNANSQSTAASASSGTVQIEGIIACIEGAILMYKNSPPELQSSVLATLNGALMTAVYTCNKVIANNDLVNYNSYNAVTGTVPESVATTPSTFYAVVEEPASVVVAAPVAPSTSAIAPTPTSVGTDANTKALEQIYNDLKEASGNAKLGLNGQLSGEEASNLANRMDEMRSLLMSELESGIPDPEPEPVQVVGGTAVPEASSSVSKYQQMLAKAKAAKSG